MIYGDMLKDDFSSEIKMCNDQGAKTPSWSIHGLLLIEYTDWKFSFWKYNLADNYCLSIRKTLPTSQQTL